MTIHNQLSKDVRSLLARWAQAVERFWYDWNDGSGRGCYGPGYIHWGVQSNFNYAAAMATLAAQPDVVAADKWMGRALGAFRFALSTHITGKHVGLNGERWGHSWISMLGIERAMHALPLLIPHLTQEDREALHQMLVSEADWLLHHGHRGGQRGVLAGLWNSSGRNAPESNIWSGALLWRTAQMYPDESAASDWMALAHRYFINGVSVPSDADNTQVIAGKPVRTRYVGANFFPHYALDHHGYLNVGYMVICVSNAAMLHFDMKQAGLPRPASLDHHQGDLWRVLRRMIFADGRLARIGGDSRVRYAYCQEYLLPALLYIADRWRDPHALSLAEQQIALIQAESDASDDGTFYGARMGQMRETNPHYFTRLESDRACVLAMLLNYTPLVDAPEPASEDFETTVSGGWLETEHSAVLHRSPTRLASFSWRARGLTQALCQPPGMSQLAEWSRNLCPVVEFLGDDGQNTGQHRRLLGQHIATFKGGFVTSGTVMEGVAVRIDEGAHCTDQAVTHIAFAALPDARTCIGLHYTVTAGDRVGFTTTVKSLHLNVPNDIFNAAQRQIHTAKGTQTLTSPPQNDVVIDLESQWINIDGVLGVATLYGGASLLIDRATQRRGGRYHSLYVDEICLQVEKGTTRRERNEVLIDVGFAILSNADADETAHLAGGTLSFEQAKVRGAWVTGADQQRYALVANFGEDTVEIDVWGQRIALPRGEAQVLNVKK